MAPTGDEEDLAFLQHTDTYRNLGLSDAAADTMDDAAAAIVDKRAEADMEAAAADIQAAAAALLEEVGTPQNYIPFPRPIQQPTPRCFPAANTSHALPPASPCLVLRP